MSRHTAMEASEFHELADDFFESQSKSSVMSTYDKIVLTGIEKGSHEHCKKVVRRALQRGWSIIDIADLIDLSLEETKRLMDEIEKES